MKWRASRWLSDLCFLRVREVEATRVRGVEAGPQGYGRMHILRSACCMSSQRRWLHRGSPALRAEAATTAAPAAPSAAATRSLEAARVIIQQAAAAVRIVHVQPPAVALVVHFARSAGTRARRTLLCNGAGERGGGRTGRRRRGGLFRRPRSRHPARHLGVAAQDGRQAQQRQGSKGRAGCRAWKPPASRVRRLRLPPGHTALPQSGAKHHVVPRGPDGSLLTSACLLECSEA